MEDDIKIGSTVKTNLLIVRNQDEIKEFESILAQNGSESEVFQGNEYSTRLSKYEHCVFSYNGVDFILSSNHQDLVFDYLKGDKYTWGKSAEGDDIVYRIDLEEDRSLIKVNGAEIFAKDIADMISQNISISDARTANGREGKIDVGFEDNYEIGAWIAGGTAFSLGTVAATRTAEKIAGDFITKNAKDGLGKFGKKFGVGRIDASVKAAKQAADGDLPGAAMTIGLDMRDDFLFDQIVGKEIYKYTDELFNNELTNARRAATKQAHKAITSVEGNAGKALKKANEAAKSIKVPAKEANTLINEAAKQAKLDAIKAAKDAGMKAREAKEAGTRASNLVKNSARKIVAEAIKNGDKGDDILKTADTAIKAALDKTDDVVKLTSQASKAANAGKATTAGGKLLNVGKVALNNPVTRVLGRAAFIATPVIEAASGAMKISEGNKMLENAVTDNQKNKAKSTILSGKVGVGTGVAIGAGITGTAVVAGGTAIAAGAGVAAAGAASVGAVAALASNPVGWVVGAGLLANYGVKYFTGRSITERATDWYYDVDNAELDKSGKPTIENPIIASQIEDPQTQISTEIQQAVAAQAASKPVITQGGIQALVSCGLPGQTYNDNVIGANTFKCACENGQGEALAKLMGIQDFEAAKQASLNGDQKFFRNVRNQDGYSERLQSGYMDFAASVSKNNNIENIATALAKNGRTEVADSLNYVNQQLAEASTVALDAAIDPELLAMAQGSTFVDRKNLAADFNLKGFSQGKN